MKRWNGIGLLVLAIAEAGWAIALTLHPVWPAFIAHLVVVVAVGLAVSPQLRTGDRRGWVHWTTVIGAAAMLSWGFAAFSFIGDATSPFPITTLGWVGTLSWLAVVGCLIWFTVTAWSSHRRTPLAGTDAVIILGAGLAGDMPGPLLASRCRRGVEAAEAGEAQIIVTGGQGPDEPCTEADAMARYIAGVVGYGGGVAQETRATNTEQNLAYSLDMCPPNPTVAVVTSDFHVKRAERLARQFPATVRVIGAPTPRLSAPAAFLREAVALAMSTVTAPRAPRGQQQR
ncbi:MAG TPA: YdcF family protein [Candidatus Corynebacterium gallistercoris]|uniref:YdcF family protein n=1 Tax=Candidatus Corynebacterium gallistercoris TaxID=2838530 RepID=A0A9D1RXH4_9CORY|nr:YdcF family protein [Candidatus Corynebacterium gallistercoris]